MLHEFITTNRSRIVALARASVAKRPSPRPSVDELERGVPLFLTHLVELLQPEARPIGQIFGNSSTVRGGQLLGLGLTVGQVVHDYGDICQAITGLAGEMDEPITVQEFRLLNLSLDDAIAGAVTEYARQRDRWISQAESERMADFSNHLRNLLSTASLSFEMLKRGTVGTAGSTGALLGHTLTSLRDLVDRQLALLRMETGSVALERLPLAELMEEIEIAASLEAQARGVRLVVGRVSPGVAVSADRQLLGAGLSNLVNNALLLTPRGGEVTIAVTSSEGRVAIAIADECATADRTPGDGALAIGRRAIAANGGLLHIAETRGERWIFTVDLPQLPLPS